MSRREQQQQRPNRVSQTVFVIFIAIMSYNLFQVVFLEVYLASELRPFPVRAGHCSVGSSGCPCTDLGFCLPGLACVDQQNSGRGGVCKHDATIFEDLDITPIDLRSDICKDPARGWQSAFRDRLPSTSIIVCYNNEEPQFLDLTIRSLLKHTPNEALAELILVDDDNLLGIPALAAMHFPKVKLLRTPERLGVAGCRMFGAE
mmetsp:Transcript_19567/g.42252  ORF Transcript_19567/g.42252 Transcript_19567/m.42252 type:complete len:203 (-) Transcript_19567:1051-1659(-)